MGWTNPTTRSTGYLVTAANWNTDLVDNLDFLKGRAGIVTLEAGLKSDTDVTDNLGTASVRWNALFAGSVYANRYRAGPEIRELRLPWTDRTYTISGGALTETQAAAAVSGGSIKGGGSGQVVLAVTPDASQHAHLFQETEQNNAADNAWSVANNPYMRFELSLDNNDANIDIFIGLRQTPGTAVPAGSSEKYVGIRWDGTNWREVHSDGTAEGTSTNVTIAAGARAVIELWVDSATAVEVWKDGTLIARSTDRLPTGDLEWDVILTSDGGGGATARRLTLGEIIVQEEPA